MHSSPPGIDVEVKENFQGTAPFTSSSQKQQQRLPEDIPNEICENDKEKEQGHTAPKYLETDLTPYENFPVKNGSFGSVSKVFSPLMGAGALKKLKTNFLNEKQQKLWKRESDAVYFLNHHPYIVTLFGYVYTNLTDAIPIGILMEFMSGGNLYDHILDLAATGKYPTSPYLKNTWAKQIALGLNFMHSRKMMHRDLKPDNILLCQNRMVAKIADFGYSRPIDTTSNYTMGIGNPMYSAPEVYMEAKAERYTEAADVWSYGMVLYFIYYEKNPYDPDVLKKVAPLMRVRAWRGVEKVANMPTRPHLGGNNVDTIIEQCWKTNPGDRCTITQVVNFFHNSTGVEMFPSIIVN